MATETLPRFEQFAMGTPERIDREKGELYGVRVMGVASSHGYEYTLAAQAAAAAKFEQMAVGVDHDYQGGPAAPLTSEVAWGILHNVRTDDRGTIADVKFLKTHARTEQILEDAERGLGLYSMSPVIVDCIEQPKGKVTSFRPVKCDIVVRGATTKTLFNQAAEPAAAAGDSAAIETLKSEVAALKAQQAKFEQFTRAQAGVAAVVETTLAKVAEKFDPKKFWND